MRPLIFPIWVLGFLFFWVLIDKALIGTLVYSVQSKEELVGNSCSWR